MREKSQNAEFFLVRISRIQSDYSEIWTRKSSVFVDLSQSGGYLSSQTYTFRTFYRYQSSQFLQNLILLR